MLELPAALPSQAQPAAPASRVAAAQLLALDVLLVVVFWLTGLFNPVGGLRYEGALAQTLAVIAWVGVSIAVLFRRRSPRTALVLVLLFAAVGGCLRSAAPAGDYVLLALYSVVVVSERRTGIIIAALSVGLTGLSTAAGGGDEVVVSTFSVLLISSVGWFAGEYMRKARQYAQDYAQFNAELVRAAEERRADQIERAVAEERVNVARELHDVVAHSMSVIAVRAGVARRVLDRQPEQAAEALAIIETTTRRTLQEMRLLVGVLRGDDGTRAELRPAPGLRDLPRLIADIEQAGVQVQLEVTGAPEQALPPAVDMSAFRITQEALTNVVRHAGPTTVYLHLSYGTRQLTIDVHDEGRGRPGPPPLPRATPGHGLIGMRERAALFNGVVSAAPDGDGFRVRATLDICDAEGLTR